jgi:hypothetical protein
MTYGKYVPEPDGFLRYPEGTPIPVWYEQVPVEYQNTMRIPTRMISLSEPGFKARPLSPGLFANIIVQKNMRQMLQPLLARDGRFRIGLNTTNKLWAFLKFWKDKPLSKDSFAQSSDFKSATDFIPMRTQEVLWQTFTSFLPVGHPFRVFASLLWGRRLLLEMSKDNCITAMHMHECGTFMGEPMSYMTLTILNFLVEVISSKYYWVKRPLFFGLTH